jgi:exocyst complex protein 7
VTPADEVAILTRGPDIMALGEFYTALDGVVGDLERMWSALQEGRGGAREAAIKDLVGHLDRRKAISR